MQHTAERHRLTHLPSAQLKPDDPNAFGVGFRVPLFGSTISALAGGAALARRREAVEDRS